MYKRFLNNEDYLSIITEEALNQIIRGNKERLSMAEEAAESSIIEYLTDNYEVEKELEKGKRLMDYSRLITYPAGAHFYLDGKICETMRSVSGVKVPEDAEYWQELIEYDEERFKSAKPYTQAVNWNPGDIVTFSSAYYECLEYNGIDFNNIRIPGTNAWEKVDASEWKPNIQYSEWEAVAYNGLFYALINSKDVDVTINPAESDSWGLIGEYDQTHAYELDGHDYASYKGLLYLPVMNPNADNLQEHFNIKEHDPRNPNIKKHLLRLAIYELHKLISPNNVSSARIADYEASIEWLRDANRMRINPQIPRKLDDENKPVAEYAIATFARDYDPWKNPWQI